MSGFWIGLGLLGAPPRLASFQLSTFATPGSYMQPADLRFRLTPQDALYTLAPYAHSRNLGHSHPCHSPRCRIVTLPSTSPCQASPTPNRPHAPHILVGRSTPTPYSPTTASSASLLCAEPLVRTHALPSSS